MAALVNPWLWMLWTTANMLALPPVPPPPPRPAWPDFSIHRVSPGGIARPCSQVTTDDRHCPQAIPLHPCMVPHCSTSGQCCPLFPISSASPLPVSPLQHSRISCLCQPVGPAGGGCGGGLPPCLPEPSMVSCCKPARDHHELVTGAASPAS